MAEAAAESSAVLAEGAEADFLSEAACLTRVKRTVHARPPIPLTIAPKRLSERTQLATAAARPAAKTAGEAYSWPYARTIR